MRKLILMAVCISLSAYIVSACESEHQNNTYELACKASGGMFLNEKCYCIMDGSAPCEEGIICIDENGKKKCAGNDNTDPFELACIASGGEPAGQNHCKCDELCAEGIVCKTIDNNVVCAMKLDCTDNNMIRCIDDHGSGRYQKCKDGKWEFPLIDCPNHTSCTFAEDDTSVCGECLNDTATGCEMEDNIGQSRRCTNGTWGPITTCADNASCHLSEDGTSVCGECLNDTMTPCNTGEEDNIGTYQLCNNGKYSEDIHCENGTSCTLSDDGISVCGECLDGTETPCEMGDDNIGIYKKCINGKYEEVTCDNDASCQVSDDGTSKCGECQNDSTTACKIENDNQNKIGKYQTCINGYYTDPQNCDNGASCIVSEDGTSVCGECNDNEVRCAEEENHIQYCKNGQWLDPEVCAGRSECKDSKCQDDDLTPCERENETKCTEGMFQECVNKKLTTPAACENSDGCLDEYTCGECTLGTQECQNIGIGSKVLTCTQNFRWYESYHNNSCKSPSEVGDCTNGFFKYDRTDEDSSSSIIKRCANGTWPKVKLENGNTQWPINPHNDSLFTHIMGIENKFIDFYTNYCNYIRIRGEDPGFDFVSPENNYSLEMMGCDSHDESYYIGFHGGCIKDLFTLIVRAYTSSNAPSSEFVSLLNKWFSCNNSNCTKVSFCVDAITTGQLTENISPNPYIITLDESDPPRILQIEKATNVCNSNRTAAKGDCTDNVLDMTNQFDAVGAFEDQETDFNICRYGSERHVVCNRNFSTDGVFTCRFDEVKDKAKVFDSTDFCLDFYDKNYNHSAYKFVGVHKYNMTDIELSEADLDKYIVKCPSNLCDEKWKNCQPL